MYLFLASEAVSLKSERKYKFMTENPKKFISKQQYRKNI